MILLIVFVLLSVLDKAGMSKDLDNMKYTFPTSDI